MRNEIINAHCDGPCGIYDPASARIAAEAVLSMTKKISDMSTPDSSDDNAMAGYLNTMSRYSSIKEQEAKKCKDELLVLWTDFFKPEHLESIPNLHEIFWSAAKLCSACKVEVSIDHANELLEKIHEIHKLFWKIKGRDITWYTAG
tara:strand:+ start:93 stop:530 length:438 start_codon:yes stop_codon:yes gene_type:complete